MKGDGGTGTQEGVGIVDDEQRGVRLRAHRRHVR